MNSPSLNTIVLYPQPSMLRGRLVSPVIPAWPAKDPADRVAVSVDFGCLVRGQIVNFDYAPSGLTVITADLVGSVVTYFVSGGVIGQTGAIATTVMLADGQQITREVMLPIVSQGAALVAADPTLLAVGCRIVRIGGRPIRLVPAGGPIALAGQPIAVSGAIIAVGGS